MCEYSGKLIPWLDGELCDEQMAQVQRHLQECLACRTQLANYEQMSKAFAAYCDATTKVESLRRRSLWASAFPAAGAVALAVALAMLMLRPHVDPPAPPPVRATAVEQPTVTLPVIARPNVVSETTQPASRPKRDSRIRSHAPAQAANWLPPEPAIQIAIPAEAMFPPGALPEGVTFTADVSFGPDGSAQQIRLRPRLVGFERRTN